MLYKALQRAYAFSESYIPENKNITSDIIYDYFDRCPYLIRLNNGCKYIKNVDVNIDNNNISISINNSDNYNQVKNDLITYYSDIDSKIKEYYRIVMPFTLKFTYVDCKSYLL